MKITYLTLFPDLIQGYLNESFIKKAQQIDKLQCEVVNIRDYSDNNYKSVDEKPYGGGDGLILRQDIADSIYKQIEKSASGAKRISLYASPQGRRLDQQFLSELLKYDEIIILNGRYGGVDQRIINQYIDQEFSIGDFVLNGGELASLALTEGLVRLMPGVLGDFNSAVEDSFYSGLLECPQFTKPIQGQNAQSVPEILRSGNHPEIAKWKKAIAMIVTYLKKPELFYAYMKMNTITEKDKNSIAKILNNLSNEDLQTLGLKKDRVLNFLKEFNEFEVQKRGKNET